MIGGCACVRGCTYHGSYTKREVGEVVTEKRMRSQAKNTTFIFFKTCPSMGRFLLVFRGNLGWEMRKKSSKCKGSRADSPYPNQTHAARGAGQVLGDFFAIFLKFRLFSREKGKRGGASGRAGERVSGKGQIGCERYFKRKRNAEWQSSQRGALRIMGRNSLPDFSAPPRLRARP